MTDATAGDTPQKRSKLPLIIGLVLALSGGGGGFYAVYSGIIFGGESASSADGRDVHDGDVRGDKSDGEAMHLPAVPIAINDMAFVPLEPLVISLPPGSRSRHLRFRAQLEVPLAKEAEVHALMPRVIDVLNGYLRAVEPGDFDDPAILGRLRAQMLRRVQIVTGTERVRDLLIMEFVLN